MENYTCMAVGNRELISAPVAQMWPCPMELGAIYVPPATAPTADTCRPHWAQTVAASGASVEAVYPDFNKFVFLGFMQGGRHG